MLSKTHISTLVLTLLIAATAVRVLFGVDTTDVLTDLRTIETPSQKDTTNPIEIVTASTTQNGLIFIARDWIDGVLALISEPLRKGP